MNEERLNEERLNEERLNEERLNDERLNEERLNEERLNDARLAEERVAKERLAKERSKQNTAAQQKHRHSIAEKNRKKKEVQAKEKAEKEKQKQIRKQLKLAKQKRADKLRAEKASRFNALLEKACRIINEGTNCYSTWFTKRAVSHQLCICLFLLCCHTALHFVLMFVFFCSFYCKIEVGSYDERCYGKKITIQFNVNYCDLESSIEALIAARKAPIREAPRKPVTGLCMNGTCRFDYTKSFVKSFKELKFHFHGEETKIQRACCFNHCNTSMEEVVKENTDVHVCNECGMFVCHACKKEYCAAPAKRRRRGGR